MTIADIDGSGTIDFGEFTEFLNKLSPDSTEDELKQVFD